MKKSIRVLRDGSVYRKIVGSRYDDEDDDGYGDYMYDKMRDDRDLSVDECEDDIKDALSKAGVKVLDIEQDRKNWRNQSIVFLLDAPKDVVYNALKNSSHFSEDKEDDAFLIDENDPDKGYDFVIHTWLSWNGGHRHSISCYPTIKEVPGSPQQSTITISG